MAVTKHGDTWDMQGNAAYSLRDDSAVVSDKVVPIFLTSCKVEPQHLEMFTEGLRYDHVYAYIFRCTCMNKKIIYKIFKTSKYFSFSLNRFLLIESTGWIKDDQFLGAGAQVQNTSTRLFSRIIIMLLLCTFYLPLSHLACDNWATIMVHLV